MPVTTPGIFVGYRQKSNGFIIYNGPEEGFGYKPIAYFEVWLVSYAVYRDILVCLPSDVRAENEDDYDSVENKGGG
jgi:hypothetical protein